MCFNAVLMLLDLLFTNLLYYVLIIACKRVTKSEFKLLLLAVPPNALSYAFNGHLLKASLNAVISLLIHRLLIPCITGGIACGKTQVSNYLKENGFVIIDMDIISRQIVLPGKPAYLDILNEFGNNIANQDGSLNRRLLRSIVFKDPAKRKKLNKITHPRIFAATLYEILYHRVFLLLTQFRNVKAILVSPLLFESKVFTWICSPKYVVYVNRKQQIKYLMERDSCTEDIAKSIIDSQMSLEDKCKLADIVFWNNSSLDNLHEQVKLEFSIK